MSDSHPQGFSVHRSEALSDGIYAVAMTLLVIELKLPEHAALNSAEELSRGLIELMPKFEAWFISFFVLSLFWFGHHNMFKHVKHADGKLISLNLAQLAFVSLMPFSCALIGEHAGLLLSQIVYSVNMSMLALCALLMARYVHRHPGLSPAQMPLGVYRAVQLRLLGLVLVSVVAVLIAMALPGAGAGNAAFALMAVIVPLSRRIERRAEISAAPTARATHSPR